MRKVFYQNKNEMLGFLHKLYYSKTSEIFLLAITLLKIICISGGTFEGDYLRSNLSGPNNFPLFSPLRLVLHPTKMSALLLVRKVPVEQK
jgi:hypothetical protein